MNSPEPRDSFVERIEAAARELRGAAPEGAFERALLAAHDADAAHAAAARTLVRPAPLSFAEVLARAEAPDGFDLRIAAAARELRRPAPEGLLDAIRATSAHGAAASLRPRLRLLPRAAVAVAATLVAAVTLLLVGGDGRAAPSHPALLTADALQRATAADSAEVARGDALAARLVTDLAAADDEASAPLLEELAFLDGAIAECRAALAQSPAHRYLREQLAVLTTRRVELLALVLERRG